MSQSAEVMFVCLFSSKSHTWVKHEKPSKKGSNNFMFLRHSPHVAASCLWAEMGGGCLVQR